MRPPAILFLVWVTLFSAKLVLRLHLENISKPLAIPQRINYYLVTSTTEMGTMKKLLTLTAAVISFNAAAVVIEDDAIIEHVSHQQVEAAVRLVRAKGYRCDSVSSLMPTLRGGFTLKCNNWRYVYSIADRGGRYVVTAG